MRAQAVPEGDHYRIRGTKIFITWGEHDMAENIIHLVLARVTGAPEGVKGISLFVVPKFMVNADGMPGARNDIRCVSIEHKLGIHGSPTCVLAYGDGPGAVGYLVGQPHRGLEYMFTMMNHARLGVGMEGIAISERSYQHALEYARTRVQGRAIGQRSGDRVTIIHHPDVRRMLLTQKAIAEGGRAMIYGAAQLADKMFAAAWAGDQAGYKRHDGELGFFTPILKGFLTEMGLEAANLGMQVFGGHGYIQDHGMEQIVRDARISTLYEGTTGIQALDLLGRKVLLGTKGKCVREFSATMLSLAKPHLLSRGPLGRMARSLVYRAGQWNLLTTRLMLRSARDREQVGAASYDFLMYSGFCMMADFWLMQAIKASELLASGSGSESAEFYQAKIDTAGFYFARLLPRAGAHYVSALASTASLMQTDKDHLRIA